MKNTFFFIILTFLACSKDDNGPGIDADSAIDECREDRFTDSLQISRNLIGEWSLVSYSCGFCPPDGDKPEATIIFKESTGTLHYQGPGSNMSESVDFSWSLRRESVKPFPNSGFFLMTEPQHPALSAYLFCKKYMYYDYTPVDGEQYLYRKK